MRLNGDFGLAIAADNKTMADGGWKFDSRKKKLTVDVNATPSHAQVIETLSGGTKFVLNAATTTSSEETLFRMEHKMPFRPKVLCYFYVKDAPIAFADSITYYEFNTALMLYNAVALGGEKLYAETDEKYFFINHRAETYGFGSGNTTFYGSDYKYRVKFEILNQRSLT